MKTYKFLSVVLVLMMLACNVGVCAAGELQPDSECWINLTDYEATSLLEPLQNNGGKESFVFVFYRDTCGYSQRYVPQFCEYAEANGIKMYGLNNNDYRNWYMYSNFISGSRITFPLVIAYDHKENVWASEHSVHSVEKFHEILQTAGFDTRLIGENNKPTNTIEDIYEETSEHDVKTDVQMFIDVPENSEYFNCVNALSAVGIIAGYNDGSFKPDNTITRAETAAIVVRAGELDDTHAPDSIYVDVSDDFWGRKYIMTATEAGILNGMGNGMFEPQSNVTYAQIIKMLVCMQGDENEAYKKGGWPYGYIEVAYDKEIISGTMYSNLKTGRYLNENATRGDVAQLVYNSMMFENNNTLLVGDKTYFIGMTASELGKPDEILGSTYGFEWYVYGTANYRDFFAAGVYDNIVVALASSGGGFKYNGYTSGDTIEENNNATSGLYIDKNDGSAVHGVMLLKKSFINERVTSDKELAGESKMNFHFTNAFRVYHGQQQLHWSDKAATAARLHSIDMAKNNYFNHTSEDGTKFSSRLKMQGINWMHCSENIYAGGYSGFSAYDGWVNSIGHRNNMLGGSKYLGVGAGFSASSSYKCYFTQDFYA